MVVIPLAGVWHKGIYLCLSALESIKDSNIQINFCDSNSVFR